VNVGRVALDVALGLALAAAFAAQMLRWLRVLQREHYAPRSMLQFIGRWSSPQVASAKSVARASKKRPITLSQVLVVALLVTDLLHADVLVVLVTVLYGIFCPVGLSIKGRTSQLQWTRRLTTIALVATLASLAVAVAGAFTVRSWVWSAAVVWAVPAALDIATRVLAPRERRSSQKFVDQAVARLARVKPRIVAITGSYGKTSTKNHLADLLREDGGVVASPRSFNNRAGLSRAINENLADGTRIFIAEMGTYGPGEIRDLCSWCAPEIAVVTAIGPVHLERMKSLDVIDQAKFEVTEKAAVVVLNIDDVRLSRWVERLLQSAKRVRTCGSLVADASVRVEVAVPGWSIIVDGTTLGTTPAVAGVQPTNLACAIGCALELGLGIDQVMARVARVGTVANRSNVATAASGVVVIDDTFNANPASAAAALKLLSSLKLTGRLVVVTPGLIELGPEQYGENMSLAQKVGVAGAELVVVGRTNVRPMEIGYAKPVRRFDTRERAVDWVRSSLAPGDGVLYLNDLPDHYP
jgi:UDP-N-acetylmuramoyl-tripeptide--D-alanyl-D-alanine ligase